MPISYKRSYQGDTTFITDGEAWYMRIYLPKVIIGLTFCSLLLFTGNIYGWSSLSYLLKKDGVFRNFPSCSTDITVDCEAQDADLNLLYTVCTSLVALIGPVAGYFIDIYQPWIIVIFGGIIESVGIFLIGATSSLPLLMTGSIFLAIGCSVFFLVSFKSSTLVQSEQKQAAILITNSCLFDASSVVFLALKEIGTFSNLSRFTLFTSLAVMCLVLTFSLSLSWRLFNPDLAKLLDNVADVELSYKYVGPDGVQVTVGDQICEPEIVLMKPFQKVSFWKQVKTVPFFAVMWFSTVHMFRSNFFLGTMDLTLNQLGDGSNNYIVTTVYSILIPCGALFIPVVTFVVNYYGTRSALQIINVIGILWGILVCVSNLWVQFATIFIYTLYRAFVYSITPVFVAQVFGVHNMGKIVSSCYLIGGIAGFLQSPIVYNVESHLQGNFLIPNIVLTTLVLPLVVCIYLFQSRLTEDKRAATSVKS